MIHFAFIYSSHSGEFLLDVSNNKRIRGFSRIDVCAVFNTLRNFLIETIKKDDYRKLNLVIDSKEKLIFESFPLFLPEDIELLVTYDEGDREGLVNKIEGKLIPLLEPIISKSSDKESVVRIDMKIDDLALLKEQFTNILYDGC